MIARLHFHLLAPGTLKIDLIFYFAIHIYELIYLFEITIQFFEVFCAIMFAFIAIGLDHLVTFFTFCFKVWAILLVAFHFVLCERMSTFLCTRSEPVFTNLQVSKSILVTHAKFVKIKLSFIRLVFQNFL